MDGSVYAAMVGDFGPAITLIVVIAASLIAVLRLGIRFDLNKFLEARKRRHVKLAQANCPHVDIEFREDEKALETRTLLYTTPGRLDWVCQRCGMATYVPPDEDQLKRAAEYFAANPDEYQKRLKAFEKHAKKSF